MRMTESLETAYPLLPLTRLLGSAKSELNGSWGVGRLGTSLLVLQNHETFSELNEQLGIEGGFSCMKIEFYTYIVKCKQCMKLKMQQKGDKIDFS